MKTYEQFIVEKSSKQTQWERSVGVKFTSKGERELFRTVLNDTEEAHEILTADGFNVLGDGSFASVYGKSSSKRVIKIARRADHAWLKYARYAIKNRRNPHLMKIEWFKEFNAKEGEIFIAAIEKLVPFNLKTMSAIKDPDTIVLLCMDREFSALRQYVDGDIFKQAAKMLNIEIKSRQHLTNLEARYRIADYMEDSGMVAKARKSLLAATINKINKLKGSSGFDLHDDNVMIRPRGELVITDPLAW